MSSKNKLGKFRENETFGCLYQPKTEEVLNTSYTLKGKWGAEVFKNNNPIILELGCGKGEYTIALAEKFPEKNFIGIDIKGARLWKGAKYAEQQNLGNVAFIRTRIEFIASLFAQGEISEIWITFPDPQLKRHRKRLTGTLFLQRYKEFMSPDGIINLKTDSKYLHNYTLALAQQNSLEIIEANNDIYNTGRADDILSIRTFYEAHYIKRGLAITYMAFKLNNAQPLAEPQWEEEYWLEQEAIGRENTPANKG